MKPGAPWCTLCYTDLRPAPAKLVAARVSVYAGAPGAPGYADALAELSALSEPAAPYQPVAVGPELIDAEPSAAAEVPEVAGASEQSVPTWPCLGCGAAVVLTEPACPVCGGGFLQGMAEQSLEAELPGLSKLVGRYQRLSKGERIVALSGLGLAVSLTFVALLAIVGMLTR